MCGNEFTTRLRRTCFNKKIQQIWDGEICLLKKKLSLSMFKYILDLIYFTLKLTKKLKSKQKDTTPGGYFFSHGQVSTLKWS